MKNETFYANYDYCKTYKTLENLNRIVHELKGAWQSPFVV